jgi:hypothetical protein
MIPALDHRGLLPHGIHIATIDEIRAVFCFNAIREQRLESFLNFLRIELIPLGNGLDLYAAGSYLTDKPDPGDIDCTIEIPANDIHNRIPLLNLFNDGRSQHDRGRLWNEYRVDAYPTLNFPGSNDFRDFFQYVGEKTATLKNLNEKDRKGIIKVESWTNG